MYRFIQDSFFLRFIFAAVVVFLTYNAEGFSYFHWIFNNLGQLNLYMAVAAIVLVLAWLALIRASISSLSIIGFAIVTAMLALLTWLSISRLGLHANDKGAIIYIIELAIILALSSGAPWSRIKRKFLPQSKTKQSIEKNKSGTSQPTTQNQSKPEDTQQTTQSSESPDTILLNDKTG